MGRKKIPKKTQNMLWIKAGARCEMPGCNKYLIESDTAPIPFNGSNIAHIVADSEDGPRGNKESERLAEDINNLMLMCPACHAEIDKKENFEFYTVELLTRFKKEHEERIKLLTAIKNEQDSQVITYYSDIAQTANMFTNNRIKNTILPEYYSSKSFINLGFAGKSNSDNQEEYWSFESKYLEKRFLKLVNPILEQNTDERLLVFAMAPIPLLIKLGTLLDDKITSVIYQKHRNPDTWKWLDETEDNFEYKITYPEKKNDNIALKISFSGTITNDRIYNFFQEDNVDICTITIKNPNPDFLRTKAQLDEFGSKILTVFDKLKELYGEKTKLHLFPACPIAIAIEMGRRWFKKCDMTLVLYDQNKDRSGFIRTFELNGKYFD